MDFVRLHDVERYSALTLSEVRRYAHLISGSWAFDCPSIEAIIGEFHEHKFRGCGVFEFSGWLSLSDTSAQALLAKETLTVRYGQVIDRVHAKMRVIQQNYPFSKFPPNQLMCGWGLPHELDYVDHLIVFPKFGESASYERMLLKASNYIQDTMNQCSSELDEQTPTKNLPEYQKLIDAAAKSPEKVLYENPFKLTVDQLGISLESLRELEKKVKGQSDKSPLLDKERRSLLEDVLERLFLANPAASSTTLWNNLRDDIQADGEKYNMESLVTEVSRDFIYWSPEKDGLEDRKLARRSFDNWMSDLRKKYKK